ncbi:MAG: ABC transporter ATP-binding protein [Oleiphilaceae bacterium]|nr:ABC transporter ATP-binding protein [Oleiphilaceae bacterium]
MNAAPKPLMQVSNLGWRVADKTILSDISFHIESGRFVGLLGPNGAGKSSLMRCMYRVIQPSAGQVMLAGKDIWQQSARAVAQQVAVIVQEHTEHFGLRVRDVVAMGLIPHKRLFEWETAAERDQIEQVIQALDLIALADRPFAQLSGGEKQRCMLARAMVQSPQLLIMDEPTNHLDVHYQIELLHQVREMGVTVFASFHDLNLAAAFCDELLVLDQGRLIAQGKAGEVLTEDLISTHFRTCAVVDEHPLHGHPRVTYAYHGAAPDEN